MLFIRHSHLREGTVPLCSHWGGLTLSAGDSSGCHKERRLRTDLTEDRPHWGLQLLMKGGGEEDTDPSSGDQRQDPRNGLKPSGQG